MLTAKNYLRTIREKLDRGDRRIFIDYPLQFTKGETYPSRCDLFIDSNLKREVIRWVDRNGGYSHFMSRYRNFDPRLDDESYPAHFPVYVLSAEGQISEGRNIFMFFPEVLGISTGCSEDYFGLELIDVWEAVFDQVVSPCVQRIFDVNTQFDYFETFCTSRKNIIYLASIFHEVGHRVGPWKVSPTKDERISISKMQVDIMGELSTDTYLVKFLPEFPELASFVLYQRLFWFGRMKYEESEKYGALNSDNDAWIGAYLWQVAEAVGCLSQDKESGRWSIDKEKIYKVFDYVFSELLTVEKELLESMDQVDTLQMWLDSKVPQDEFGLFVYPESMSRALRACSKIPTRVNINQPIKV